MPMPGSGTASALSIACRTSILKLRVIGVVSSAAGVTVRGSISRDVVLRVVRAHGGEVQQCVERQRLLTPGVSGALRTTWRVRADGSVLDVRVLSAEHEHLPLGRCVTTVISRWRFPAMGAEWAVTFPFQLGAAP